MKKRFCALLLAVALSGSPAFAGKWMAPYESLIEAGQLGEVLARAKQVRDGKRNDPEAWLEYAFIAKACGASTEARDAYAHYAKQFPQAAKVKFALRKVKKLQSELDSFPENVAVGLSGDDYCLVDRIATSGVCLRWSKEKMPLKVSYSVAPGLDAATYRAVVNDALKFWSNGSNNLLSFVLTDKGPSDIDIFFTADVNNEHVEGSAGNTRYKTDNRQFEKASCVILTTAHYTGKPRPLEKISRTVTHELGHAIGLAHSKDPSDLMYFAGNWSGRGSNPSERDLRVLGLIYQTPAPELYQRVEAAIKQVGGENCPMLVKLYSAAGEDQYRAAKETDALAWFEKADKIASELKRADAKESSRRLWFLSAINYKLKNYDAAIPYYKRYVVLLDAKDPKRVSAQRILDWCERHKKGTDGTAEIPVAPSGAVVEAATAGDGGGVKGDDTAGGAESDSSN